MAYQNYCTIIDNDFAIQNKSELFFNENAKLKEINQNFTGKLIKLFNILNTLTLKAFR
jgi:hypothetical protein